ncbi:MAG: peptidoglycan-binding protein [Pseudomonadota bacterium]
MCWKNTGKQMMARFNYLLFFLGAVVISDPINAQDSKINENLEDVQQSVDDTHRTLDFIDQLSKDFDSLIDRVLPGGSESPQTIQNPTVQEIQSHLAQLGFDPGPADGVMGPKTQGAILTFQKVRGLPADGLPSTALLKELRSVTGSDASTTASDIPTQPAPNSGEAQSTLPSAPNTSQTPQTPSSETASTFPTAPTDDPSLPEATTTQSASIIVPPSLKLGTPDSSNEPESDDGDIIASKSPLSHFDIAGLKLGDDVALFVAKYPNVELTQNVQSLQGTSGPLNVSLGTSAVHSTEKLVIQVDADESNRIYRINFAQTFDVLDQSVVEKRLFEKYGKPVKSDQNGNSWQGFWGDEVSQDMVATMENNRLTLRLGDHVLAQNLAQMAQDNASKDDPSNKQGSEEIQF